MDTIDIRDTRVIIPLRSGGVDQGGAASLHWAVLFEKMTAPTRATTRITEMSSNGTAKSASSIRPRGAVVWCAGAAPRAAARGDA